MAIGQLAMQQLLIYTAHFDFTTAEIMINCTFKHALPSCAAESIKMAQANNKNVKELLNFIIQLDLLSNFADSVASAGNEVKGAQCEFSFPPMPGILFSSETVLICLREF